jgi:hypothetical protein
LDGININLIDTPGFDDTRRFDTDVLKEISQWFTRTLDLGVKLSGIIYLHPVTLIRMGQSSMRNLRMFRNLCGDDHMENVILATSHWTNVPIDLATQREKELLDTEEFCKPLITKGARYRRYQGYSSGLEILQMLVKKERFTTLFQEQLVGEGRTLLNTEAGQAVNEELIAAQQKHNKDLEELRTELKNTKDADLQSRNEMLAVIQSVEKKLSDVEKQKNALAQAKLNDARDTENRFNEYIRAFQVEFQAEMQANRTMMEKERSGKAAGPDWEKIGTLAVPVVLKLLEKFV